MAELRSLVAKVRVHCNAKDASLDSVLAVLKQNLVTVSMHQPYTFTHPCIYATLLVHQDTECLAQIRVDEVLIPDEAHEPSMRALLQACILEAQSMTACKKGIRGGLKPPAQVQYEAAVGTATKRPANTDAAGVGPSQALKRLAFGKMAQRDIDEWAERARVDAILGSCSRSLKEMKCGVRCYKAFVDATRQQPEDCYLPPRIDTLLAWSTLFRSRATFSNYLGYLRTACLLTKCPTAVFQDPALARAKASAAKRGHFTPRPNMWIRRATLERIMKWCDTHLQFKAYGDLFLLAYAFLLRLPSEALPVWCGGTTRQASLRIVGKQLDLSIASRYEHTSYANRQPLPTVLLCRQEEPAQPKQADARMLVQ